MVCRSGMPVRLRRDDSTEPSRFGLAEMDVQPERNLEEARDAATINMAHERVSLSFLRP